MYVCMYVRMSKYTVDSIMHAIAIKKQEPLFVTQHHPRIYADKGIPLFWTHSVATFNTIQVTLLTIGYIFISFFSCFLLGAALCFFLLPILLHLNIF